MKKFAIIWTIVLMIIIGSLTFVGFKIKEKNNPNYMEEDLIEETKRYLGLYTNKYPKLGNYVLITNDELIENDYDANLDEKCTGYVIVKNNNNGFEYKAYIKCPDYVTKDYSANLK